MRIGVVGSRNGYGISGFVEQVLSDFVTDKLEDVVVSGGCSGVDAEAKRYAQKNGFMYCEFPPMDEFGSRKFHERNQRIVESSDIILAFPNKSKGTWDTINLARKAGKRVIVFPEEGEFHG